MCAFGALNPLSLFRDRSQAAKLLTRRHPSCLRSGRDRVCMVDPGADIYAWKPGTAMQKLRARIDAHRQQMVRR